VAAVAAAEPALRRSPRVLLDERFADNRRGWPDDPRATAWLENGRYRMFAREPGRFVAVGVPSVQRVRDASVTATFRKVGGPPGGGYGFVVRDQADGGRDGTDQRGRYYVFEVGDRGEVGLWRRDDDRWIDLLPWTASQAVRPGNAANEVAARVTDDRLVVLVNGIEVVNHVGLTFPEGTFGVFVGGDNNEVVVEALLIEGAE
jgi:hypothetical protein